MGLRPEAAKAIQPTKTKRERLLMLPRLQETRHASDSIRHGDYLRGRLLAPDPEQLRVESRLEKRAAGDRISIIWLHPDEPGGGPAPASPAGRRGCACRPGGSTAIG